MSNGTRTGRFTSNTPNITESVPSRGRTALHELDMEIVEERLLSDISDAVLLTFIEEASPFPRGLFDSLPPYHEPIMWPVDLCLPSHKSSNHVAFQRNPKKAKR